MLLSIDYLPYFSQTGDIINAKQGWWRHQTRSNKGREALQLSIGGSDPEGFQMVIVSLSTVFEKPLLTR